MPSLPLRIAILECDTPVPPVVAQYGTYGQIFTKLFSQAADTLSTTPSPLGQLPHPTNFSRADLHLTTYDVVTKQEYPDLSDIDAILMSGSKHTAYHNDPWILKLVEFVEGVFEGGRVRVVGVCFGHQIAGRALGAECRLSGEQVPWEVSVVDMSLTDVGKAVFGRDGVAIHQMHRDIVATLPPTPAKQPPVQVLASTPKCAIHGMYVPKKLITIQGHPEFNGDVMRKVMDFRREQGIFGDEIYADALARADRKQDGLLIAQAFLRFMLED